MPRLYEKSDIRRGMIIEGGLCPAMMKDMPTPQGLSTREIASEVRGGDNRHEGQAKLAKARQDAELAAAEAKRREEDRWFNLSLGPW